MFIGIVDTNKLSAMNQVGRCTTTQVSAHNTGFQLLIPNILKVSEESDYVVSKPTKHNAW
jgi:hypothetical protein